MRTKIRRDGLTFVKCNRCCGVRVKGLGCCNDGCFEFSEAAKSKVLMVMRKESLINEVIS